MKYLLDTNVISEFRKAPDRMNSQFRAWMKILDLNDCGISTISIFELERGVLLKERRDKKQGRALRAWLNDYVYANFKGNTLSVTEEIARKAAHFHVPNPAPYADAFIAATAAVNNCILVTRNTQDFNNADIMMINPWEDELIDF